MLQMRLEVLGEMDCSVVFRSLKVIYATF
jgi:hypothetical protein